MLFDICVLKKSDVFKYLEESEQLVLEEILSKITCGRVRDNKKPIDNYYVVNKDEPYAEVVHGIIIGGEAVKEQSISDKKERLLTSDEDCADCLCRVCARNRCNDSYNRKAEEDGRSCECNCKIGDKLIETEDDCPDFLPDEDT